MKKVIILIFLLCSVAVAEKPYLAIRAFNAGELWEGLSPREDLAKYHSGCSLMENMIPIPQGGAEKRPGTKYVAESKNNTVIRLLPFEYSTEQSYIIELGNQYIRFFTNNAAILDGVGVEDISDVNDNLVAHWLLNETLGVTIADDDGGTYDATSSADASTLHVTGKVGTGCFDLDGQYNVYESDDPCLSFTDDTNDEAFSLVCWAYITQQSGIQALISKWDETTGAAVMEYRLSLNNDRKLQLHLGDTNVDLTADLLAQWYLNDTDADTTVDEVGTTYTGTLTPSNCDDITATGKTAMTPCFDFGGAEAVEVADNNVFSFVTANNDDPFSITAWVYVDSSATQIILSKYDGTVGSRAREWMFMLYDGYPSLQCWDESTDGYIHKTADDALDSGWYFVAVTYDGTSGNAGYDGMTLYVDGEVIATSTGRNMPYVAMENTATKVIIGAAEGPGGALTYFWQDKIDNVIIFDAEISAATISALYNGGTGREVLTSTATEISAVADDALSLGWHFLASTYSAPDNASATAANGIILYVDGAAVDSTKANDADYGAMQDGAGLFRIGAQESIAGAAENFWGDKIDEVSVFKDVLTPTEVASLYTSTPYEVNTPYLTTDLFELKYKQSADVLYITHPDYETRKLSRYANALWTITAIDIDDGPFRTQNSDVADFIAASATTGTVTLTATGCTPFVMGATAGHEPSGSAATSKSQTGALFKLVHPLATLEYSDQLEDDYTTDTTEGVSWMSLGTLYEGAGWTLTTLGTWTGTLEIQRNYTIGAAHGADGWESIFDFASTDDRNVSTAGTAGVDAGTSTTEGTEADGAADYRAILTASTGDAGEVCKVYWTTDQTEVIGIVEITSVASATSAIGTVVQTIASTNATHKWSEGSWSNYRGWPIAVAFFEDRLIFGGNTSQPDTIWGSVTADYENMEAGVNDDDAIIFTLSSRQVNVIRWLVGKNKILIGTSGAEWSLSGAADEPLTPSNVKAEQQSTYGSANLQANLANESVLFFQRGAEKMRELAYNWELDSYVAPDMTILAKEVTGDGITNTAFQQIPDSILWCVKENGDIAIFSYERKENITSWSRLITDDDFESVAIIHGAAEDQVWVSVERVIGGESQRYIEYFSARDFGSDPCDAFYVDCGATYTTDVNVISDLTWLEGESVIALADGDVISGLTVASDTVTLGGVYQQVQIGLPYTIQLRTMPLSWVSEGGTIQGRIKRINKVIPRWYNSGDFYIGKDSTDKELVSITGQTTSEDRITFPPGYDRPGYVYVYQLSPEPLTLLALMVEFMIF